MQMENNKEFKYLVIQQKIDKNIKMHTQIRKALPGLATQPRLQSLHILITKKTKTTTRIALLTGKIQTQITYHPEHTFRNQLYSYSDT